jgi:hypothetical protein
MILCFFLGHDWQPLRFQPHPDPQTWIHQCSRCGKSEPERNK